MKTTTLLLITTLIIAGCTTNELTSRLCDAGWVQENTDISCVTTFNPDGTLLVDYENGPKLPGTWTRLDGKRFHMKIVHIKLRAWEAIGRLEGEKLILKAKTREQAYVKTK